jgi:protein-S-isoprenylcysteine O-methyltransferase Ste14
LNQRLTSYGPGQLQSLMPVKEIGGMCSGKERVHSDVIICPLIGLTELQGHHANLACYKSGIMSREYCYLHESSQGLYHYDEAIGENILTNRARRAPSPRSRQIIAGIVLVLLGGFCIGNQDRYDHVSSQLLMKISSLALVLHVLGIIILVIGVAISILAWIQIPNTHRIGNLVTTGIYSRTRNPVYLAFILIIVGIAFLFPGLLTLMWLVISIMALYGLAKLEERDLKNVYGNEYLDYKRSVPLFFPRLKK